MAKKHSKNLQKVQDMLDGRHESKIISGYMPTEETHKVGDIWTDSDGKKWEQKNGYRVNITKLANAGIAKCVDQIYPLLYPQMIGLGGQIPYISLVRAVSDFFGRSIP